MAKRKQRRDEFQDISSYSSKQAYKKNQKKKKRTGLKVLSVTFAYVTNRKWVFESRAHGFVPILTEAARFFASRIASGFMEMGMMFIGVDLLHVNDKIVKLVANIFVILANYILSKLVVFRKKK